MTLGALLVMAGLVLVYGSITDQDVVGAVRSVLSGAGTPAAGPPPAASVGADTLGGGDFGPPGTKGTPIGPDGKPVPKAGPIMTRGSRDPIASRGLG